MPKFILFFLISLLLAPIPKQAFAANECEGRNCKEFAEWALQRDYEYNKLPFGYTYSYKKGSAKIRKIWTSPSGMKTKVTVDFVYTWRGKEIANDVILEFRDGEFHCIQYSDTCRPLN